MNLAVITGTTRGLGASLKDNFEAIGWRVVSLNRPEFDLAKLDMPALDQTLSQAAALNPDRAVFVSNAATHAIGAAADMDHELIAREITVNITSPIAAISTFLRHFPSGEIACITSAAATQGFSHWPLYCAAKAAMEGFLRALAAEGITVSNQNPGALDTDMQANIRSASFPGVRDFIAMKENRKLRSPAVVARALVWKMDRAVPQENLQPPAPLGA